MAFKFRQQLIAVCDHPGRGRLDERELRDFPELQRTHAQDHSRQRNPKDLGVGEFRALQKIRLIVQAYAHAAHHPAAASGALVGGRTRDLLDVQLLDFLADAVAVDPRQAAVDHIADVGHGQRSLGDVGRQHHTALSPGLEHPVLLRRRQAREQRQYFQPSAHIRRMMFAQRFRGVAYLALAGQEHQHIAAQAARREFIECAAHRLRHILRVALLVHLQRAIARFDRVTAPGHLDHRRAEMPGEALGVQRRRGDDQLQVGAARQQLLQIAEQEIDVQASARAPRR